jgi:hypothetical protein
MRAVLEGIYGKCPPPLVDLYYFVIIVKAEVICLGRQEFAFAFELFGLSHYGSLLNLRFNLHRQPVLTYKIWENLG